MGIEKKGRTIRFDEDTLKAVDELAYIKEVAASHIVRLFIKAGLEDQRLQRGLFGDDKRRKVTA